MDRKKDLDAESKARQIWQFLSNEGRKDHFEDEKFLDDNGNLMEDEFEEFINSEYDKLPYENRKIVIASVPYLYNELSSQDYWKEYFEEE